MAKTLPWKTKLAALRKFKELEGHTNVRQSYVDPETNFRLGRWVANIRQRSHFLNDSQLQDLEDLDFVWSRFKVLPWDVKIDMLHRFKRENGHLLVAKDYVDQETGFHLGWWVDRMRQAKKSMNKSRLQDLEDVGFVWNAFDASWDAMYNLLQEYKQQHQHVCPKINEHYKDKPLGHWVGMQRQLYSRKMKSPQQAANKTAIISHKRIALLQSIGFVWRLRTSGSVDYEYNEAGSTSVAAPSLPLPETIAPPPAPVARPSPTHDEQRLTPAPSFQSIEPIPFTQATPPQPQYGHEHPPPAHYHHHHHRHPHHRPRMHHYPQAPQHYASLRAEHLDIPLSFMRMARNARSA